MTDVKHMKWWGWGLDGVGFHWEDKPGFAPFVLKAVGLDLLTAAARRPALVRAAQGAEVEGDRGVHPAADRHRRGRLRRPPTTWRGSCTPTARACVTSCASAATSSSARPTSSCTRPTRPRCRRSWMLRSRRMRSSSRSAAAPTSRAASSRSQRRQRTVISLDLGRLRSVARRRRGVGPRPHPGRRPGSRPRGSSSTTAAGPSATSRTRSPTRPIGGWVATRSSGMQSDKYGDIADIAKGLRVVRPVVCSRSSRRPAHPPVRACAR